MSILRVKGPRDGCTLWSVQGGDHVRWHSVHRDSLCQNVRALEGGPQCRMSISRNGNVACHCHLFSLMSHVEFKKRLCPMSL